MTFECQRVGPCQWYHTLINVNIFCTPGQELDRKGRRDAANRYFPSDAFIIHHDADAVQLVEL